MVQEQPNNTEQAANPTDGTNSSPATSSSKVTPATPAVTPETPATTNTPENGETPQNQQEISEQIVSSVIWAGPGKRDDEDAIAYILDSEGTKTYYKDIILAVAAWNDGTIVGNVAQGNGGGVLVYTGEFHMKGGNITANTVVNGQGGSRSIGVTLNEARIFTNGLYSAGVKFYKYTGSIGAHKAYMISNEQE